MSTKTRDQMSRDSRGSLLCEWTGEDKETYRLIAIGRYTAGYEDRYVIEKLGADSLGEPTWSKVHEWKKEDADACTLLVGAIKAGARKS